jgi:hypothetical protein
LSEEKSANDSSTELVVPAHGRGALRTGGKPGNKGGGRTPSALRKMALKKSPKMLQVLEKIALSETSKESDRVAAAREHVKIALGSGYSETEVRDKVQATIMMIDEQPIPDEVRQTMMLELRRIWLGR